MIKKLFGLLGDIIYEIKFKLLLKRVGWQKEKRRKREDDISLGT